MLLYSPHNSNMENSSTKLFLKWNEFKENIVSSFQGLRQVSEFSDVTLVCEDLNQIEAHRIILTACSPFFRKVLKSNNSSHPMIYMRGLKAKDLVAIVDFIYHGEANIYEKDMVGFLALAEELQLEGLVGSQHNTQYTIEEPPQKQNNQNDVREKHFVSQTIKSESTSTETINQEEKVLNLETVNKTYKLVPVYTKDMPINANMADLKGQINSMMEKVTDGETDCKWKCSVCGKVTKTQRDMGRHIETHLTGVCYPCNVCGVVKKSSNALNSHVARHHKC